MEKSIPAKNQILSNMFKWNQSEVVRSEMQPHFFEVSMINTPLKINMEPKNEGLEDDFPFILGHVQVPC